MTSNTTPLSPSWRLDETLGHAEIAHVNAVLKRNGLRTVKAPCRVVDAFALPMKVSTFTRVAGEIVAGWEQEEASA